MDFLVGSLAGGAAPVARGTAAGLVRRVRDGLKVVSRETGCGRGSMSLRVLDVTWRLHPFRAARGGKTAVRSSW